TRERHQVVVCGRREVIAHVGAWLVVSGQPIPPDLQVDIPDLESALLTLLDNNSDPMRTKEIAS
ncbi:MAG: hypothetical protein ACRDQF_13255, partial [Thermocrispum sp.]